MTEFTFARNRLALVWCIAALFIFVLLIAQTIGGKFEDKAEEVWSWALSSIMPTLTLIVTVLASDALKDEPDSRMVKTFFFRLAMALSIFYLGACLLTFLVEPIARYDILQLIRLSRIWLGPIQSLVTSSLSLVFFSKSSKGSPSKLRAESGLSM